jgi:hypothetical protein
LPLQLESASAQRRADSFVLTYGVAKLKTRDNAAQTRESTVLQPIFVAAIGVSIPLKRIVCLDYNHFGGFLSIFA